MEPPSPAAGEKRRDSPFVSNQRKSKLRLPYFTAILIAFLSLFALALILVFSHNGLGPGSESSSSARHIFHFIERKIQARKRINGEAALVILGGSGSLYSIRAARVEHALNIPVINWGLHAGLGLNYLLFNAKRQLRSGDIALLVLEYEHYVLNAPEWTLADFVIPNDPSYVRSLHFFDAIRLFQKLTIAEYLRRITVTSKPSEYNGDVILESINDNGDLVANRVSDQKDFHRRTLQSYGPLAFSPLEPRQLANLKAFSNWCRAKNIQLIIGFPSMILESAYSQPSAKKFFADIIRFYRDQGLIQLGSPEDYLFDRTLFFDSRYHMTDVGAKLMSGKIVKQLENVPLQILRPNEEALRELQDMTIDFSSIGYPGFIDKIEGVSGREGWGRWTDKSRVSINFVDSLPNRFTLEISVYSAFGKNVNAPISVRVGDVARQFSVPEQGGEFQLHFDLRSDASRIELFPISAVSPKDLGLGEDTRGLGIGLKSIRIVRE